MCKILKKLSRVARLFMKTYRYKKSWLKIYFYLNRSCNYNFCISSCYIGFWFFWNGTKGLDQNCMYTIRRISKFKFPKNLLHVRACLFLHRRYSFWFVLLLKHNSFSEPIVIDQKVIVFLLWLLHGSIGFSPLTTIVPSVFLLILLVLMTLLVLLPVPMNFSSCYCNQWSFSYYIPQYSYSRYQ